MNGKFRRKSNLDCWTRLDTAAQQHEVTYEWIKGHNGDPEQETADTIARTDCRDRRSKTHHPHRSNRTSKQPRHTCIMRRSNKRTSDTSQMLVMAPENETLLASINTMLSSDTDSQQRAFSAPREIATGRDSVTTLQSPTKHSDPTIVAII